MDRLQMLNKLMGLDISINAYAILFKVDITTISYAEFSWLVTYIETIKRLNLGVKSNLLCNYLSCINHNIDLKISPKVRAFEIDSHQ